MRALRWFSRELVLASLIACLAGLAACGRTASPPGATRVPLSGFTAVAFVSRSSGWLGGPGFILTTVDGGRSWTLGYRGAVRIRVFDALNSRIGWAAGVGGLLHTADGGAHWTPLSAPGAPLAELDFATADEGWALTAAGSESLRSALLRTADGGRHWTRERVAWPVQSVCAASAKVVWAAGRDAAYRTVDGGRVWRRVFASPGRGMEAVIRCAGPRVAWLLVNGPGALLQEPYALYRTADAGARWSAVAANTPMAPWAHAAMGPGSEVGALDVVSAQSVFLVGFREAPGSGGYWLGKSTDGGRTWSNVAVPGLSLYDDNRKQPLSVSFVNGRDGWLATSQRGRGILLVTRDGGVRWQVQPLH